MKILKVLGIVALGLFVACGGGGDDEPTPVEPVEKVPEKASLVFPENNEECNTGIQQNATQSLVNFSWNEATNATSYELVVVDLLTGSRLVTRVNQTNADMLIKMSNPFEWHVVSLSSSSSVRAESDEWKFYNSGPATTTYAPFPAEALQPARGSTITGTSVDLQWETSDVDGDLASFEVYFGTVSPPTEMIGSGTDAFLNGVAVENNTYYWMVKSIDAEGNSSNSEVFEFKVSN